MTRSKLQQGKGEAGRQEQIAMVQARVDGGRERQNEVGRAPLQKTCRSCYIKGFADGVQSDKFQNPGLKQ